MKKAKDKPVKTRTNAEHTRNNAEKEQNIKKEIPHSSALVQHNSTFIEWQAPEFEYVEKDVSWYWMGLIVSILLLAAAVWQKNFLFAIFVVIAYLAVIYSAGQRPAIWKFTIDNNGVEIDPMKGKSVASKIYNYEDIEGFDIWDKELVLKVNKKISPYVKMIFPADKEKEIKEFLAKHVPESEYEIPISDSLSKLIGF